MNKIYTSFKCKVNSCKGEFIVPTEYLNVNERKGRYLTCPYCNSKNIKEVNAVDNLKECMDHATYKKVKGAFRQVHSG
ncbi:UNVERIFIED_ORG: hypothetical protein B2H93_14540 [Clostridium botulinum]